MKKALVLIATVAMLFSCRKIDQQRISGLSPGRMDVSKLKEEFKEGEIMVRFKPGVSNKSALSSVGAKIKKAVRTKAMERMGQQAYYIASVDNVQAAVEELRKHASVDVVSPNYKREVIYVPTDPAWTNNELWGMSKIGADVAWQSGNIGDTNVYVGISDEGIMYWHEDLCGQVWTNPYDPEDGIDNDGNGYVDDIRGWCAFHSHNQIYDGNDRHGTHVSGTVGGKTNDLGVVGVAPKVRLISGKSLEGWGYDEWGIQMIDYLTDLKVRHGVNIVAINCSWGGGGYNQFLKEAIERAGAANILVVCAAGNSTTDNDGTQPSYPASYDCANIISVGALDWNDAPAYFSSYGSTTVDIFAPGTGIKSSIPSGQHTSTYDSWGGTSMAAPHVTGAVALYASLNPGATAAQIKAAIMNSAISAPALQGKCVTGGYLNVRGFTGVSAGNSQPNSNICPSPELDVTPPSIPTLSLAGTGVGSVSLSWTPATDNQTSIKEYWIYVYPTSEPQNTNDAWIVSGTWTSMTVFGLNGGTSYSFFITARDAWSNESGWSNVVTATPLADVAPPTPPEITQSSAVDSTGIFYIFNPSTDDQSVSSYKVYYRIVGTSTWSTQNQVTYQYYGNILGLTPGNTYEAYMTATDIANNESVPSNLITVSLGGTQPPPPPGDTEAPSIPTGLAVTGSTTSSLSIAWNASSDNVGVTGYNVFWRQQGGIYQSFTSVNRVANFTGLPEGTTYEFYVNAFDAAGNISGNSTVVSGTTGVTPPPPPPPVSISATLTGSNNGQIHNLNWTVTSNTSNPLTYELEVKEQGVFNLLADVSGTSSYSYIPGTNKKLTYRLKVTEASSGTVVYSNEVQVQSKNINRGD